MKRPIILSLALSLMTFAACGGPQGLSPVMPHPSAVNKPATQHPVGQLTANGQITVEPGERPSLRFQVTYHPEQFRTQALDCTRLASFQIYVDGIGMTPMYADNASGENHTVNGGGTCTITARISAVPSGRSRVAHVIPYDSEGNPQTDLALSAAFDLTNPAENPKAVYLNFRSTPVGQIIQTLLDSNLPLLASKTDIVDLQTLIDQVIGTTFDPGNPSVVIDDFTLIHPLLVNQAAILEDLQNNGANVEELLNLPPDQLIDLLNEYRLTPATVSGTVTGLESGDTLTVRLLDPVTGAQTNVSNNFSFTDVPPGTWQLVVEAPPGYQVVNAPSTVTVTAGQTVNDLNIEVAPNAPTESYQLQSTGATSTTIGISWSEVSEATGYNVYVNYQLVPGGPIPPSQTTSTLTDLTPSTAYHVEVKPIIAGSETNVIPAQDFATESNWNSWGTVTGTASQHVLSLDSATFPDQVFFGTKAEGTSSGGVWKCAGGSCGISLSLSGSAAEKNVYAVAIDPQNANIIYAGTGGQGLFKSEDNGANWGKITSLPAVLDIRAILVDPVNPNIVYMGTNGSGVYRSSDRGETWALFTTNLNHPKVHALAIYNSPDGGSIIYAGTEGGGVYRQINNTGDNNPTPDWKTINLGIFGSNEAQSGDQYLNVVTVTALASHPTNSALLYGGGIGGYDVFNLGFIFFHVGVWQRQEVTGNTVANWNQIGGNGTNSFPCPTSLSTLPAFLGGGCAATPSTGLSNMQILALAVDPITPTTIYAATENGIFRTTNGNANPPTWTNNFASGQFTGRVNAIGSSPARLYIGTSTGLYRAATTAPL